MIPKEVLRNTDFFTIFLNLLFGEMCEAGTCVCVCVFTHTHTYICTHVHTHIYM